MGIEHRYGENVHFSANLWLRSLIARIGSQETPLQEVPSLVRAAYRHLIAVILAEQFPAVLTHSPTRMAATEPRGYYDGPVLDPATKLVIVAVIRGGIVPAQTCYEEAFRVLSPENVRLDFLNMSRTTDAQDRVTGVRFEGSKIGGPVTDAVVVIPDPMCATGGTVARTVEVYKNLTGGAPRTIVASHLMITPEAVHRLTEAHPELQIYSARFDRGLSPETVLATIPGTHPDEERGLTDNQYIVPGAGGIGELLTNSWV